MKINTLGLAGILVLLLTACSQDLYKSSLVPSSKNQTIKNVFGAYIEVESHQGRIVGELISVVPDTLHVLNNSKLEQILFRDIISLEITLSRPGPENYALIGGLSVFPSLLGAAIHSDYSTDFLSLAGLIGIPSLIAIAAEGGRKPHVISYPGDIKEISSIWKYARFPFGLPDEFDFSMPGT